MALGWEDAALEQLKRNVRPAILFRLGTDTVLRLWSGAGDLTIDDDLVEDDPANIYQGIGAIQIPAVNQLVNGIASRVEFTLAGAGVGSEIAAIASTTADDVRGATVNLGFAVFDQDWQLASPTAWLWEGVADSMKIGRSPGADHSATYTIGLSVGSIFTGRQRPTPTFWTDPDQRRRSADDRFCDRVRLIAAGTTRIWPD